MTNKTKTILCVCALTASAFAWNATAEDLKSGVYDWPEGHNGAWHLNNPGDIYFKQTLFESVENNAVLSFSIERNDTDNGFIFGTYTYDTETHELKMTTLGTVGKDEKTIKLANNEIKGTVESGIFNKNDSVGVWVRELNADKTEKDITYYSENSLTIEKGADTQTVADYVRGDITSYQENPENYNGSYYFDEEDYNTLAGPYRDDYIENLKNADQPNWAEIERLMANPELIAVPYATFTRMQFTDSRFENGQDGVASLFFDDDVLTEKNYGFPGLNNNPTSIKIRVTGYVKAQSDNEHSSTGQPLPGVWATIALAGAASAYLKRRRKENK
jgi:hypothetical protein